jgi:hypothetical protein
LAALRSEAETFRACSPGKHLLPCQGATATLDEVQSLRRLIGSVDVEIEIAHFVQGRHRKASLLQQCRCGLRTRYDAVNSISDAGQQIDKDIDGGSSADAEDRTWLDELQGCFGGFALLVS